VRTGGDGDVVKRSIYSIIFVQIINTLGSEKSWMKEELDRINQQLQKQMAEKEGCYHE